MGRDEILAGGGHAGCLGPTGREVSKTEKGERGVGENGWEDRIYTCTVKHELANQLWADLAPL